MAAQEAPTGVAAHTPAPPASLSELREDVHPLGKALKARAGDVLDLTTGRSAGQGDDVDAVVQDRFQRINRSSTIAMCRWLSGEGVEAAIEAGRETWVIYGELAAHRAASLNQLTKRCLWWRDSVAEVLRECAVQLDASQEALSQALNVLQLTWSSAWCGYRSALTPSARERTNSSRAARRSLGSWRRTTRSLACRTGR